MFVKRMYKNIGINGTLHEFRHTKGSNLIAKGVEIEKVSKFLGHQSTKTTDKYYIHSTDKMLEDLSEL